MLLALPLGEVDLRSKDGEAHAAALSAKVSSATRNLPAMPKAPSQRELSPQATKEVNPAPCLQIKIASFLRFTAIFSNFAAM